MSSGKWWPFCLGLNVLIIIVQGYLTGTGAMITPKNTSELLNFNFV